jgi:hypothetical protein
MSRIAGITTALLVAGMVATGPVAAQENRSCGPRVDIIKQLAGQFQEQTIAVGLSDNGAVLEILTSPDGETWTMLFSMPTGVSCLIATGQDWQVVPRVAKFGPPV